MEAEKQDKAIRQDAMNMVVLQTLRPEVYEALMDPEYIPEGSESDEVFYPGSEEEFAAMIAEWENG